MDKITHNRRRWGGKLTTLHRIRNLGLKHIKNMTIPEIAAKVKKSEKQVDKIIRRYGIEYKRLKPIKGQAKCDLIRQDKEAEHMTALEIAGKYKVKVTTIYCYAARFNIKYKNNLPYFNNADYNYKIESIFTLADKNTSIKELCNILSLPRQTVYGVLTRNNLPFKVMSLRNTKKMRKNKTPSKRYFDCCHYNNCLNKAFVHDLDLDCAACLKYSKEDIFNELTENQL